MGCFLNFKKKKSHSDIVISWDLFGLNHSLPVLSSALFSSLIELSTFFFLNDLECRSNILSLPRAILPLLLNGVCAIPYVGLAKLPKHCFWVNQ